MKSLFTWLAVISFFTLRSNIQPASSRFTVRRCPDGGFFCDRLGTPTVSPAPSLQPVAFTGAFKTEVFSFSANVTARFSKSDYYILTGARPGLFTAVGTLRAQFTSIIEALSVDADAAFGVGFFRDESSQGTDNGFVNLQSITKSIPHISSAFSSLRVEGGGDFPDANLVALHRLATDGSIGWRPDARKIIVYIGASPGHEPTCDRGKTLTRQTVIEELNTKNIGVVAVSFGEDGLNAGTTRFGECSDELRSSRGQADEIVRRTSGTRAPFFDQEMVVSGITAAVAAVPYVFYADSSDCEGIVSLSSTPSLPIFVFTDTTVMTQQELTVRKDLDTDVTRKSCILRYFLRGGGYPKTLVSSLDLTTNP